MGRKVTSKMSTLE